MNKKAFGMIGVLFSLIVLTLIYWTGLAPYVASVGEVAASGLTGVDAWFYSNINLVALICNVLAFIVVGRSFS